MERQMIERQFKEIDGKQIPIGNDPNYDYEKDYRRARAFSQQEVTCTNCHTAMLCQGRAFSPLYGAIGEHFKCACGAELTVYPAI
jgi:hypothetical protein